MQQLLVDVTGRPFPALMQELVLGPAGMSNSTFEQPLPAARASDASRAHDAKGKMVPGGWHVYPEMAPAGLWTTPTDLTNWALAITAARAGKSTTLLSQPMVAQMLTPVKDGIGLGPFVGGTGRNFHFGHGGANEGFHSHLVIYPELGVGAAVMTNGDGGPELIGEVLRALAAEYQWPDYAAKQVTTVALEPAAVAGLLGKYLVRVGPGVRAEVRKDGDKLMLTSSAFPAQELLAESDTSFVTSTLGWRCDVRARCVREGDGNHGIPRQRAAAAGQSRTVSIAVSRDVAAADAGLFGWWRVANPASRARSRRRVARLGARRVRRHAVLADARVRHRGARAHEDAGRRARVHHAAGGAAGGLIFGHIADRFGRTRAMIASVLLYSVFTAACGLSQTLWQFAIFRALLGLGMGGEWASGAALVSETWPAKHRGRALGFMQSSWAIGFAAAAIVVGFVLPRWGWRAVFFVGILPAFFTLWVRRNVEEPDVWKAPGRPRASGRQRRAHAPLRRHLPRPAMLGLTSAVTFMNACALFGWWGLNGWMPAYLSLPVAQGGVGLGTETMSWFIVAMQVGMWLGYVSFGYITDVLARKRVYVTTS